MPKEVEKMMRWKGKFVTEKVYNNRLRQRQLAKEMKSKNKEEDLKAQAEASNASILEKKIREAEIVTNENGSNANGKKPEIETVYYQNEMDESGEVDSLEALEAEESRDENHVVEGRRIVELSELGKRLWCGTCKEALSLSNVEKECRRGFGSLLLVRCHKCLIINEVATGKMHPLTPDARALRFDINTDLALGMLNSGMAVASFNKVLSYLKIPLLFYRTLKKYEEELGEEEVAAIKARRNCAPMLEEES